MSLRECYEAMGADYDEMFSRVGNEGLMERFLHMFLEDGSYEALKKELEEKNAEEAFKAAHTLKGVALNLALTKLVASASEITDALRGGNLSAEIFEIMDRVTIDYERTTNAIKNLS